MKPTDQEIRNALAGLIGLIQLLEGNEQVPISVRTAMVTNSHYQNALLMVNLLDRELRIK